MKSEVKETFLALVRYGIGHTQHNCPLIASGDWMAIKALADRHGLSAVVLDGLNEVRGQKAEVRSDCFPTQQFMLQWIGEVMQSYEVRYKQYEQAICSLAGFYNSHGFKMMVLKGYACSLDWPKPEHRPCGDIDIWLFNQQEAADKELVSRFKVQGSRSGIDNSHHHHTVFEWEGFTVENHYDFLNVHHHKSNVEMEAMLKELGDECHTDITDSTDYSTSKGTNITGVKVNGERVYLPSPNLHALFLLRHSMSNFASTGFQLRQLLDWAFFVEKHGKNVDWEWLERTLEQFGMKRLYDVFSAICVGDLGFDVNIFPQVQFDPSLKDRVLNDILSPEFSEVEKGGFVSRALYKYRRWKANAWKHELCFKESMWSAFWSGVWGHLLKPRMI